MPDLLAGVGRNVMPPTGEFANNGFDHETALPWNSAQLGVWALLATLSMLFAGFTSAYLVRRAGLDWQPIPMPPVLWLNTGLLLLSSLTMETARARDKQGRADALRRWLLATTLLGVAFLAGQLFAWRQLVAQGVFVPTSPHSSFFYMLTGVHGLHVLGGLAALVYALGRAWRSLALQLCAAYWHFVDLVWLYLFLLLWLG